MARRRRRAGKHRLTPAGCAPRSRRACRGPRRSSKGGAPMTRTISLSSPSFQHEGEIPGRFTCEGADVSPALEWEDVPPEARSLALIVDDPDAPDPAAPRRTWVHWVLYDIPASATGLTENAGQTGLPPGTRVGKNDWQK